MTIFTHTLSRRPEILNASILIVDDQQSGVLLLERMLRGAGYVSITSTMNPGEVCELHPIPRDVALGVR